MLTKLKYLFLTGIIIFPALVFSHGKYTRVSKITLYSEYFSNPKATFKGTIVFQNGAGTDLQEWAKNKSFFRCVSQYGNLFMYDRSGLGKSPPDVSMSLEKPMTAKLINAKLIQLLGKENIKPPYLLVGHSYGGMYAGYFARKFPNLVKGVLMIDPVPPNYKWTDAFLKQYQSDIKKMKLLTSEEAYKQFTYLKRERSNAMPAQLFYQLMGFAQTKFQLNKLPPMNNKIPIIIISSSYMEKNAPVKGDWYQLQKQWLNKNPHSKIMQVNSGHFIQLEHPTLVCKQIERLANGT